MNKFWYTTGIPPEPKETGNNPKTGRKILQKDQNKESEPVKIGVDGYFSEDARDSMDVSLIIFLTFLS